jgi:hypothetical protein
MSVYANTIPCSAVTAKGTPCKSMARFLSDDEYVCGTHSKSDQKAKPLSDHPNPKELAKQKLKDREDSVSEGKRINNKKGKKGSIVSRKYLMKKSTHSVDNYLSVFPNKNAQNSKVGFGCSSLSPMLSGPVIHNQPGIGICYNLENFHQGNKCNEDEVDEDGLPLDSFYKTRKEIYEDEVPNRHKGGVAKKDRKKTLFSVWFNKDGEEGHYDYISARQFYCTHYYNLNKDKPDFLKLQAMLDDGINLNIIGFDGYDFRRNYRSPKLPDAERLDLCYLDEKIVFGHELVLSCMLILDYEDYPWVKNGSEDI